MEAITIIVTTVICCAIGYTLNKDFNIKYGQSGIDYLSLVFQCFFVLADMCTWQRSEVVSGWFILWTICLIASYVLGIYRCRKHAIEICSEPDDIGKAIVPQCILPVGVALVIIILLAIAVRQDNKRKKKR